MVKNKAIFLDSDGTINYDYGDVHECDKLKFIDGSIEGLKRLYNAGYILIIITNQSGIRRGYFNFDQYNKFNDFFLNELKKCGVVISHVYTCPHIDNDNCECRKPKLGLFNQAIIDYNIDLANSFAIGDKERDLSICDKTLVRGILINGSTIS